MEARFAGTMLTGPTVSEHAGRIEIPLDVVLLVRPKVGGTGPYIASLDNQSHTVAIECIRRYATILDAMEARATFLRTLPLTGQLELFQYSLGATLTIVADGAVKAPSPAPVLTGRSLAFRFQFACPIITAVQTLEDNILRAENGTILLNENGSPLLA